MRFLARTPLTQAFAAHDCLGFSVQQAPSRISRRFKELPPPPYCHDEVSGYSHESEERFDPTQHSQDALRRASGKKRKTTDDAEVILGNEIHAMPAELIDKRHDWVFVTIWPLAASF